MLTIDDIRSIPLFSTLPLAELERLARTSADVHLSAGEFAVHEGADRALYAVLSGKIEVVKVFDGVERTLGWRLPGVIFGEVPMVLGTPFPGGYRASEPSRVMRVEPQQYYAVAAVSPEISLKVGALARERMGGLQGIAAEPPKPRVTMVGNRWDAACTALRQFLSRNQISYEWMTPDAPELSKHWPGTRPSDDDCPVLRLADGKLLRRPPMRDLAELLGLQTKARLAEYDTMIIGGGPAVLQQQFTVRLKDCARSWWSARLREVRPEPRRASRTISASRAASSVTSSRAAHCSRQSVLGLRTAGSTSGRLGIGMVSSIVQLLCSVTP